MSHTRGEGRSAAEKSGRLIETPGARAKRLNARRREEEEWAARSGPVTVLKVDPPRQGPITKDVSDLADVIAAKQAEIAEACPGLACFVYTCPTSKEDECLEHGGFDVCCDDPACPAFGRRRGQA